MGGLEPPRPPTPGYATEYVLIWRKTHFVINLPKGKLLTEPKFLILSLSKFSFLIKGVTQTCLRTSGK